MITAFLVVLGVLWKLIWLWLAVAAIVCAAVIFYVVRTINRLEEKQYEIDRIRAVAFAQLAENRHSLTSLEEAIAEINRANGWYDKEVEVGTVLALIHSEISEALEEWRKGGDLDAIYYEGKKPEGFGVELADALIRILDASYRFGLNMDDLVAMKLAYNRTRGYRHGGKAA